MTSPNGIGGLEEGVSNKHGGWECSKFGPLSLKSHHRDVVSTELAFQIVRNMNLTLREENSMNIYVKFVLAQ